MTRLALGCITVAACELALLASCDCGPRMRNDDVMDVSTSMAGGESTSTGDASHTATSIGNESGYEPLRCREGEVQCGDECANLRWSNDHCGACEHGCRVKGLAGECWEGTCATTHYCAFADQGHSTCSEVCASYGETCVDTESSIPGGCGDRRYTLYYVVPEDFDCQTGHWASASLMGGCNDPIRWDFQAGPNGGSLPGAVSCCCTQP